MSVKTEVVKEVLVNKGEEVMMDMYKDGKLMDSLTIFPKSERYKLILLAVKVT